MRKKSSLCIQDKAHHPKYHLLHNYYILAYDRQGFYSHTQDICTHLGV